MHLLSHLPSFLFLISLFSHSTTGATISTDVALEDTADPQTNLTADSYTCFDDSPTDPGPANFYDYCAIALQNLVHQYPSRPRRPRSGYYLLVHDCALPTPPGWQGPKLLCPIKEAANICEVTFDFKVARPTEPDSITTSFFEHDAGIGNVLGQVCKQRGKFRGGRVRQFEGDTFGRHYTDVVLRLVPLGTVDPPGSAYCDASQQGEPLLNN